MVVHIPENYSYYSLEDFAYPKHYEGDVKDIMIPHGLILNRVEKLAQKVFHDNQKKPLVLLCVLKGGHQVFSDLVHFIENLNKATKFPVPLTFEFVKLQSYENDKSLGTVKIQGLNGDTIRGKNVLVVEDIVDTGRSMIRLLEELEGFRPQSVKTLSLLVKRTPLSNGYTPNYAGFSIPDNFIVGYCLDYNDQFRDLGHICTISEQGIEKYKQ